MGSEDMSLFLQMVPGAIFFVGAGKKSQKNAFLYTTLALILMKAALLLRLRFYWRLASNWRNQPDGT